MKIMATRMLILLYLIIIPQLREVPNEVKEDDSNTAKSSLTPCLTYWGENPEVLSAMETSFIHLQGVKQPGEKLESMHMDYVVYNVSLPESQQIT